MESIEKQKQKTIQQKQQLQKLQQEHEEETPQIAADRPGCPTQAAATGTIPKDGRNQKQQQPSRENTTRAIRADETIGSSQSPETLERSEATLQLHRPRAASASSSTSSTSHRTVSGQGGPQNKDLGILHEENAQQAGAKLERGTEALVQDLLTIGRNVKTTYERSRNLKRETKDALAGELRTIAGDLKAALDSKALEQIEGVIGNWPKAMGLIIDRAEASRRFSREIAIELRELVKDGRRKMEMWSGKSL